jgi:hypothetical protein
VDRFLVLQENDPEISAFSLVDSPPELKPAIRLNVLPKRVADNGLDPFQLDPLTVRSSAVVEEVLGELSQLNLHELPGPGPWGPFFL